MSTHKAQANGRSLGHTDSLHEKHYECWAYMLKCLTLSSCMRWRRARPNGGCIHGHAQGSGQWTQPGPHRLPAREGVQVLSRHAEVPCAEQLHVMVQGPRKWGCIHGQVQDAGQRTQPGPHRVPAREGLQVLSSPYRAPMAPGEHRNASVRRTTVQQPQSLWAVLQGARDSVRLFLRRTASVEQSLQSPVIPVTV